VRVLTASSRSSPRSNSRAGVSSRPRQPPSAGRRRQPHRRSDIQPASAALHAPPVGGASSLQARVDATLRELEEIKAGTHAAYIPPKRPIYSSPAAGQPALVELHRATSVATAPASKAPMSAPVAAPTGQLAALLAHVGLEQYHSILLTHGLEDVPALLSATAAQLQGAGMKMGHALRLLNSARSADQEDISSKARREIHGRLETDSSTGSVASMGHNIVGSSRRSSSNSSVPEGSQGQLVTSARRRLEVQVELERAMRQSEHADVAQAGGNLYARRDSARALVRQITSQT
jgi:hypothetical protein